MDKEINSSPHTLFSFFLLLKPSFRTTFAGSYLKLESNFWCQEQDPSAHSCTKQFPRKVMNTHSPLARCGRMSCPHSCPFVLTSIVKMGNCPKRKQHDKESCISRFSNSRIDQVVFLFLTSVHRRLPTAETA